MASKFARFAAAAGQLWQDRGQSSKAELAYQRAIDILCRPWTALILGMLQKGPLRFSELEARSEIGTKTLSARLKELEKNRIIAREVDAGPPVRVEYSLTKRGRAFEHVAAAIEKWGRELIKDDVPEKKR